MPTEEASIRVLVVDDNRIVADSLSLVIRGRGFDSRAAYSGESAVQLALAWEPHAAIVDAIMRPMDGVSLAVLLAKQLPACRVLLMSGNPDSGQLLKNSEKLGHNFPFLAKPFDLHSIFEFLDAISATESA